MVWREIIAALTIGAAACTTTGSPAMTDRPVTGIAVSPLALTPSFSVNVPDYTIPCAAGINPVSVTVTDADGDETIDQTVTEDQLISVRGQYWIRCLPHDFPAVRLVRHPEVGSPTPGLYLVNSSAFAIAFNTDGVPVWYRRGTSMFDVSSPAPNEIAFMPNVERSAFNTDPNATFHLIRLGADSAQVAAVDMPTDGHELRRLASGNHLVLSYPIRTGVDLTGLGSYGRDETIADCAIQELDPSGALVWSWLATDHVDPARESLEPGTARANGGIVVDPFHCNSIEADPRGNLLLSMRHANAVFYIDRATGAVQWKLGGTPDNRDGAAYLTVVDDPQGAFSMQHDARILADGHISMFDNHGASPGVARGVEYALDLAAGTARFVSQIPGDAPSAFQGSFRRYPDGHSVISWGGIPGGSRVATEFDALGRSVFEIQLTGEISYRAVKVPPSRLGVALLRADVASP